MRTRAPYLRRRTCQRIDVLPHRWTRCSAVYSADGRLVPTTKRVRTRTLTLTSRPPPPGSRGALWIAYNLTKSFDNCETGTPTAQGDALPAPASSSSSLLLTGRTGSTTTSTTRSGWAALLRRRSLRRRPVTQVTNAFLDLPSGTATWRRIPSPYSSASPSFFLRARSLDVDTGPNRSSLFVALSRGEPAGGATSLLWASTADRSRS